MERFDVEDYLRWTLSRRGALRAGLAAGATLLGAGALAGCSNGAPSGGGSGSGGGAASAPSPPTKGAVVPTPRDQTVVMDSQGPLVVFDSFNHMIPNGEQYDAGWGQVCKEYMWYQNLATGELTPWQATGWQYNADFTQLTLSLNPKVHWNDGQPYTSKDVKFTIDLNRTNKTLTTSSFATEITSADAPDDHTVVIKLNTPDPRFHYTFFCGIIGGFLTLPQHVWAGKDPTTYRNSPPVQTGPYKLYKVDRELGYYIWEKDPNYWNKDQLDPAPRYVAWRNAPVADAANQDFKNAVSDSNGGPSSIYTYVKQLIGGGYKNAIITSMIDPCPRAILVNSDPSKGVLAQPKFRQALSALIDRQKVATTIWPVKTPAGAYPWPSYPANSKWENSGILSQYPQAYDPQRASQLLDEAGAVKGSDGKRTYQGKPISVQIISPQQPSGTNAPEYVVAQLLAQELQKQGIDASYKLMSGPVFSEVKQKGQYDIRSEWYCEGLNDPYSVYHNMDSSKFYQPVGQNALLGDDFRLKDPTLDDLAHQLGTKSPDDPAARPLFDQALTEFFAQQPVVPYLQTMYTHQFNTTYWTGWPTDDNLYQVPNNWWGQFMFVIGRLKPTGKK